MPFDIKDSGKREQYTSGMQRDTAEDKIDYSLVLDGPMFDRWAVHLTKGAKKYDKRNWMKASGTAELTRFKESALRHFLQWYRGEQDEDHASAVIFNVNGAEFVREQNTGVDMDKNLVVPMEWERPTFTFPPNDKVDRDVALPATKK